MKLIGMIAGGAMALGLCAASADAAVVYTYTGDTYGFISGIYSYGNNVSGSFTVDNALGNGLVFDAVSPTAFSFSDGNQQITNLNASLASIRVSTNGIGDISKWIIAFRSGGLPGLRGDISTAKSNAFTIDSGQQVSCAAAPCDSTSITTIGQGITNDRPGTWSATTVNPPPVDPPVSGVPEPAAWALMLVGFGGLGATLRRRRATATTPIRSGTA